MSQVEPPDSAPQDAVEFGRDNESDPLKIAKLWLEIKRQPAHKAMDILAKAALDRDEHLGHLERVIQDDRREIIALRTALVAVQAWWKTGDDFDRIPIEKVDAVLAATPPTPPPAPD